MSYIIVGIILVLAFFWTKWRTTHKSKNAPVDNTYLGLREMALATTPQQLHIDLPETETKIYGVVMDWDLNHGIATLISFSTGDASLYLSNGGGMVGGGSQQTVIEATKAFVLKAQSFFDKATQTNSTALPASHSLQFYFLTSQGRFIAQEDLANIENGSSFWLPLFEEGNYVISALRVLQEK